MKNLAEMINEVTNDDFYDGVKVDLTEKKITDLEKSTEHFKHEMHQILFPKKEGKINFRNLDGEKKEELREAHPFIVKKNGKYLYRTYISYFGGKESESKEMVCTGYNSVTDTIVSISFIASLVPGFIYGAKAAMALIKKISAK